MRDMYVYMYECLATVDGLRLKYAQLPFPGLHDSLLPSHSHSHSHTLTLSLSLSLSLTHTHTHTHSLQQFVKGCSNFVTEMADAVLNGLTNNRHSKFMSKFKAFEERERKLREGSRNSSRDEADKASSMQERDNSTPVSVREESARQSSEGEGGHYLECRKGLKC